MSKVFKELKADSTAALESAKRGTEIQVLNKGG